MNIKEQSFQDNYELAVQDYLSAYHQVENDDLTGNEYDKLMEQIKVAFDRRVFGIASHHGLHVRLRMWLDPSKAQVLDDLKPMFTGSLAWVAMNIDDCEDDDPADTFFFELLEDAVMFKMMMSSHGEVWRL